MASERHRVQHRLGRVCPQQGERVGLAVAVFWLAVGVD